MPSYTHHQDHVLENIQFLSELCQEHPYNWRWNSVSVYYVAVHLMHAYIASKGNYHPDTHEKLKDYICPASRVVATRLNNEIYSDYQLLEMNSRKARYHSDFSFNEKHFIQAVEFLDSILVFYKSKFSTATIPSTEIKVLDKKYAKKLTYFNISENVT